MFQYAFGFVLARRNNMPLKLDILSGFTDDPVYKRKYSLGYFTITAAEATRYESYVGMVGHIRRKLNCLYSKHVLLNRRPLILEESLHYNPEIASLHLAKTVYFDGYWQSEKYFLGADMDLRREFTLKNQPSPLNGGIAREIQACKSVSLHVRRTDYISHEMTRQQYHTCTSEYYRKAAEIIAAKMENPKFFAFSDDPDWVKNNINIGFPLTIVSKPGNKPHEELWLMSLCKHNITANSSFSWWGAWLNNNPNKIVITSRRWFNNLERETPDHLPAKWLKL